MRRQAGASRRRRPSALGAALALAVVLTAGQALAAEGHLELMPRMPMLISLLVLFVVLIFPINALLFRPIFAVLDAREEKIAGTKARAEKLAADADEILSRYQQAVREEREQAELERKQELGAARAESVSQLGQARAEAEAELDRARRQLQEAVESARASLRPQTEQLAREAAARVLGRALS